MKKACWRILPTIAGLVILSATAFAQADLVKGQDSETEMKMGIFSSFSTGNQDRVRMYDGRNFILGLQRLDSYGYSGETQYWLNARDLVVGNESIQFDLNNRNLFGFTLSTDAMTHRLGRRAAINPYLAPFGMSQISGLGVPSGDAVVDLSPNDNDFRIDRRVNEFKGNITPENLGWLRINGGFWQENERGSEQLLFRSRAATAGVIATGTRGAIAIPIDRSTSQGSFGADLAIGSGSVLNYQYLNTRYADGGTRPGGVGATVFPVNALTKFSSNTDSNIFKASGKFAKNLLFTGVQINRKRTNTTGSVPLASTGSLFLDPGSFLGHTVDTGTTNLALTYLPTNALSLTGRWRKYDQDDNTSPILTAIGANPSNTPLSRDITSWSVDGSFTGIRHAFINGGFERRDETLRGTLREPAEGFDPPFTAHQTKDDIWNAGFRFYPGSRMSLSGKWEQWNVSDAALFNGVPTDRTKLNFNATYLVTNSLSLFGDYNSWDESNKQLRADLSDPAFGAITIPSADPVVITDILEKRELAAGQGFNNKFKTWDAGLWYGLTKKLSLDTYFGRITTDAAAVVVFGDDASATPLLPVDFAPFNTASDQWAVGLNYAVTPKWRTHARFLNTVSKGQTTFSVIPGNPNLPQGWQPVSVVENRWTVGFDYQMTKSDRLIVDFSLSDWNDKVDSANTGRFGLWNVAWASKF